MQPSLLNRAKLLDKEKIEFFKTCKELEFTDDDIFAAVMSNDHVFTREEQMEFIVMMMSMDSLGVHLK